MSSGHAWNNNGVYTAKSEYHWIFQHRKTTVTTTASSHFITKNIWKILWGIKAYSEVLNFIWRAINNALPSSLNLFLRDLIASTTTLNSSHDKETFVAMTFLSLKH